MSAKKNTATEEQSEFAEQVDREVEAMGGVYLDCRETSWKVEPVHYHGSHYLRYEAEIDGDEARITGPHHGGFYAYRSWKDGRRLLDSLGAYEISQHKAVTVEDAADWAHNAPKIAEEAINTHINRGRIEAAIRKLEKDKDTVIEAINKQYADKIDAIYSKAGISPEDCDL